MMIMTTLCILEAIRDNSFSLPSTNMGRIQNKPEGGGGAGGKEAQQPPTQQKLGKANGESWLPHHFPRSVEQTPNAF